MSKDKKKRSRDYAWTPFVVILMSPEQLEELKCDYVVANSRYQVYIRTVSAVKSRQGTPKLVHLSIKMNDRSDYHSWRDYQRIKNELLGPEWECIELYPAESRLIDTSNQFHLWCFEPPFIFPIGFSSGRAVLNESIGNAVQTPYEDPPPDVADGRENLDRICRKERGMSLEESLSQKKKDIE